MNVYKLWQIWEFMAIIWSYISFFFLTPIVLLIIFFLSNQILVLIRKKKKPVIEILISLVIIISNIILSIIFYVLAINLRYPGAFFLHLPRLLMFSIVPGSYFIIKSFRFDKRIYTVSILLIFTTILIFLGFIFAPWEFGWITFLSLMLLSVIIYLIFSRLFKISHQVSTSEVNPKKQIFNLLTGGFILIAGSIMIFYFAYLDEIKWEKQNPDINRFPIIEFYKRA